MKLCRFELSSRPGEPRSGLFHDGRIYETDGQNAIGIHELTEIRLLPPLGSVPAVRLFEQEYLADGSQVCTYRYIHPKQLQGPLGEVEMPASLDGMGLQVRVCTTVQDVARQLEKREAERDVLGYCVLLVLTARDPDPALGSKPFDIGSWFGPFLVTPDDLGDFMHPGEPTSFTFGYRVKVNNDEVAEGPWSSPCPVAELLVEATQTSLVAPGEIIAWPPVPIGPLDEGPLGRLLLPSDKVQVEITGLGTLVGLIS